MADPWLTLVGLHENGLHGLCPAARQALDDAQYIFGAPRHLRLAEVALAPIGRGHIWPSPFDLAQVLALRGKPVVVLASGNPFWFGVGGSLARHLTPNEWQSFAQPSVFSLVAARLGWRLEETLCLGLHAQELGQMLPHLAEGRQLICLLRDGQAAEQFAQWLTQQGWGASPLWVLQALGGAQERCRHWRAEQAAQALQADPAQAPVVVALRASGGHGLPAVPGRPDACFRHDHQITKAAVRAVTLAALAPRHGQWLWDIGAGSGAIAVEWCLAGGQAVAIEPLPTRLDNIMRNRHRFGLGQRLHVVAGRAPAVLPDMLANHPLPQAVFVGGGFDAAMFDWLHASLPVHCRLVVNAVTLSTQALLGQLYASHGGHLLRLDMAHAEPLGRMHAWQPVRPLVQWIWEKCV